MINNLTNILDFQAQALSLRSERQRLLASNIANADTPGYKSRDMDFAKALREATGRQGGGTSLSMARPSGVAAPPSTACPSPSALRKPSITVFAQYSAAALPPCPSATSAIVRGSP